MIKSFSMMKNVSEIISILRKRFYGKSASAKDYKDSFIINKSTENFSGKPEELMSETITTRDQKELKVSKSVNLRSDCYEKINTYSKLLNIPESEVCRRILYYTIEMRSDVADTSLEIQLASLKSKVALLKSQIEVSVLTLNEIIKEIDEMEAKEQNDG